MLAELLAVEERKQVLEWLRHHAAVRPLHRRDSRCPLLLGRRHDFAHDRARAHRAPRGPGREVPLVRDRHRREAIRLGKPPHVGKDKPARRVGCDEVLEVVLLGRPDRGIALVVDDEDLDRQVQSARSSRAPGCSCWKPPSPSTQIVRWRPLPRHAPMLAGSPKPIAPRPREWRTPLVCLDLEREQEELDRGARASRRRRRRPPRARQRSLRRQYVLTPFGTLPVFGLNDRVATLPVRDSVRPRRRIAAGRFAPLPIELSQEGAGIGDDRQVDRASSSSESRPGRRRHDDLRRLPSQLRRGRIRSMPCRVVRRSTSIRSEFWRVKLAPLGAIDPGRPAKNAVVVRQQVHSEPCRQDGDLKRGRWLRETRQQHPLPGSRFRPR